MKNGIVCCLMLLVTFAFVACGGSEPAPQPESSVKETAEQTPIQEPAAQTVSGNSLSKLADFSEMWSGLYAQNEAVINQYEGMPIMELVTPATTFITAVQYDMLNLNDQDGRYEGKLMMAGYQGFMEKTADRITFGYDHTLEKDGFGPSAKAGDHSVQNGFLDLASAYYRAETVTERGENRINRTYTEFKRIADGGMICIDHKASALDMRGNPISGDHVVFLHNAPGRYDFVIAKGQAGMDFSPISFAEKGDLNKEQIIDLLKTAGYAIEKTGGIKDGKLVLDT